MATVLGLSDLFVRDASTMEEVDEDRKVRIGMLFYTLNDVILAIFFIGSYIFLRGYNENQRWFPAGTGNSPFGQETVIMIIAVVGGVLYGVGAWALRGGNQQLFRLLMALALALYVLDLAGQVWIMSHLPFTPQSGGFASSYILLSGYHVYHMAILTFLGIGLVNRAYRGRYNGVTLTGIHAIGYYWYWGALYELAFWLLLIIQPA